MSLFCSLCSFLRARVCTLLDCDLQILTEKKRRKMQRTMTKTMKGMKWRRPERRTTDLITSGRGRRCSDTKHPLSVAAPCSSVRTAFERVVLSTLTANCFILLPTEPVNRKQNNASLFDTHRSPARRSHIRLVLRFEPSNAIYKTFQNTFGKKIKEGPSWNVKYNLIKLEPCSSFIIKA